MQAAEARGRTRAAVFCALMLLTGCRGSDRDGMATRPEAPAVRATQMAKLTRPIAMAVRPGEPDSVFIAEKGGKVRRLIITEASATVDPHDVMDISDRVSTDTEQGLLGIAFSADGATLFADYTDADSDIRVVAYPHAAGSADTAAERLILAIPHPYETTHNGGQISFGPDGKLYIGTGDGGSATGNGQDLNTLLGKILRIKPTPSGSPAYTVPSDNPFAGQKGKRGEIWHYGLRNPWRWSFDRVSGEQWIGDVGQHDYEEIDHVGAGVKGVNFGWDKREAKHPRNGGARPRGAVDPEIQLTHSAGNCAVTGGYVYRGTAIPALVGAYVFADFCRGELVAARRGTVRDLGVRVYRPVSFGEDATGELWILTLGGPVYRLDPA